MALNNDAAGPAMLAVTQGISLFQTFLPHFTEIKNGNPHDPGFSTDVHLGELAAGALTLGIGAIGSAFTGSPIPMVVSVIMVIVLIVLYESALNYQGPQNA